MPNSKKAIHPSGKLGITFTEDDHRYVDDFDIEYTSCTTLVHSAFEPFDAQSAAERKSARTGIPPEQYIRQWKEYADERADLGTRTHENCERQILGQYEKMHQPVDDEERARFRAAWFEVEHLRNAYERLEPEKLVFSPRFRVAGSIDLLGRKHNGAYTILDWKFITALKTTAFQKKTGCHFATSHLPDCNFYCYALQTNLYEQILKIEGYIPDIAPVEKWLAVYDFSQRKFNFVRMPELLREAILLLAFNMTCDGLEDDIPF